MRESDRLLVPVEVVVEVGPGSVEMKGDMLETSQGGRGAARLLVRVRGCGRSP